MMQSALLNAARGDIGLQPPRARNPSGQAQLTRHPPAEGPGHGIDAPPHAPSGAAGDAHPEEQQPPAVNPPGVDSRQQRASGPVATWARGRLRLRGCAMIIIVLMALFWLLSVPVVCPRPENHLRAGQHSHAGPADRYKGPVTMFANAVGYLRFFERRRNRGAHTHNSRVTMAASGIAQRTAQLETDAAALEGKFDSVDLQEATTIRYLEASLSCELDEARYYSGAMWYWPLHLACAPCGHLPWTLPCPDHPITIARRKAREAIRLLFELVKAHDNLQIEHRNLEDSRLIPARDGVCDFRRLYTGDYTAQGRGQAGSGGQDTNPGLRDLLSAAYGMCSLTELQIQKAIEFRDQQMSKVITKFNTAVRAVMDASEHLENINTSASWDSEHVALGTNALEKLLGIVRGLKSAAGPTA